MTCRRKQLCSNKSNEEDSARRTRVKKSEREADEAQLNKDVEAGKRLFQGLTNVDETDNEENDEEDNLNVVQFNNDDHQHFDDENGPWYGEFMPLTAAAQPQPLDPNIVVIQEFVSRHRGFRYAQEREDTRQHWEDI